MQIIARRFAVLRARPWIAGVLRFGWQCSQCGTWFESADPRGSQTCTDCS